MPPGTCSPLASYQPGRDDAVEVTIPFPTAYELYMQYGGHNDGIDREEFQAMLQNLDGFSDVKSDGLPDSYAAQQIQNYVDGEFQRADLNHDGVIDLDEFTLYYYGEICFKFPVGKNGFNPGATLYNIFCNYCSYGKGGKRCEEVESQQFLKMCKECGLLCGKCKKADIDLIFHHSRAKKVHAKVRGATKLQYQQFLRTLMLVADKHKVGFCDVVGKILRHGINRRDPSMADFLIMHDPAGMYEDMRDLERPAGLPKLHRSTAAAAKSAEALQAARSGIVVFPPADEGLRPGQLAQAKQKERQHWETPTAALKPMAIGGSGCVDGNSLEQSAEQQAADAETQCSGRGQADSAQRGLGRFRRKCRQSMRKQWDFSGLARSFYDDNQNKRLVEVQTDPAQASLLRTTGESSAVKDGNHQRVVDRSAVFRDSEAMHLVRTAQEEKLTMALKYVFELFNCWDGGVNRSRMNKIRFAKVLRDSELLSERDLSSGEVDAIFFKIKPQSQDTINFLQFMEGLRFCASVKRIALNDIIQRIVALQGPIDIVHR